MSKHEDMTTPIDWFGYFWLPEEPNNKIAGKLTRTGVSEHFSLVLSGFHLDNGYNLVDFISRERGEPVLLGVVHEGRFITLLNGYQVGAGIKNNGGHVTIKFAYLLIGKHFKAEDLCKGDLPTFRLTYNGLSQWVNYSPYTTNGPYVHEMLIQSVPGCCIEHIVVESGKFCKREIENIGIIYESSLILHFKASTSFTEMIESIKNLNKLLSIFWGFPAVVVEATATLGLSEIILNMKQPIFNVKLISEISIAGDDFPVTYASVEHEMAQYISKWFELQKDYGGIFDLFYEQYNLEILSLISGFLNLMRGIESFHRGQNPHEFRYLPSEKWDLLIRDLLPIVEKAINGKDRTHIENIKNDLVHANSVSLRQILRKMKKNWPKELVATLALDDSFIGEAVSMRNRLTHQEGNKIERSMKFQLYGKIRALLFAIILHEIGVSWNIIHEALKKDGMLNIAKMDSDEIERRTY